MKLSSENLAMGYIASTHSFTAFVAFLGKGLTSL